ncbi:MAG: carboxypeptidase regulatory-like domain-containing protein [Ignavibacteriae bacterium]|nr:carboxypeptidase regulatory-like domain-containing protein [Ignavibacteriota bacterium]
MKRKHILFVLALLLSAFLISCDSKTTDTTDPTDSTATVDATVLNGTVVAAESGDALPGAIIKITDGTTVKGATTGDDGKFTASFDLDSDADLTIIVFKAGYFRDTTTVFAIAKSEVSVPLFQLQRDESSNAGGFSGRAASIYIYSQSADFIGVKESGSIESAQIAFEIMDSSGVVIGEDNAIEVSFRFGFAPNGGEYLYPSSIISNALGKVSVSMNTGTKAGVAQIIAEAVVDGKPIASKPVNITIHGGFPDQAHFSIGSDKLNYPYYHLINGEATITVLVGDKYSNPVRKETSVYFNSDAAIIGGSSLTNDMGVASVKLLSGNPLPNDQTYGPGFFFAHATTINEAEIEITTKTRILYSGYPVLTLSPTTIDIANGGAQPFTYSVKDEFGNPLASGSNYNVVVTTDGDAGAAGDVQILMPDTQSGYTNFSFVVQDTKIDEVKPAAITVTVSVSGPNGGASVSATGTTR